MLIEISLIYRHLRTSLPPHLSGIPHFYPNLLIGTTFSFFACSCLNLSSILMSPHSRTSFSTFSNFCISSCLWFSNTDVYKSMVICNVACPKYVWTVFGCIPASKHRVAKVCLKQWGENGSNCSSSSRQRFISSIILLMASRSI